MNRVVLELHPAPGGLPFLESEEDNQQPHPFRHGGQCTILSNMRKRIVRAVIGAAVLGLAIVGYLQWTDQTIPQNERAAYHALRSLASANADFRATDRDGNQV